MIITSRWVFLVLLIAIFGSANATPLRKFAGTMSSLFRTTTSTSRYLEVDEHLISLVHDADTVMEMQSALEELTEATGEDSSDSESFGQAVLAFDAEWKPENYYSSQRRGNRKNRSKRSLLQRFKRRLKGVFLRRKEKEVVVTRSSKKKRKKGGSTSPVALLQLSTRERVWIIDLQSLCRAFPGASSDTDGLTQEELLVNEALAQVFVDPRVLKLGLGPATDLKRLSWSYPHMECFQSFNGVIDVSSLAKKAHPDVSARSMEGLSKLCQHVLQYAIDKSMQCSDWSVRPLSQEQLNYASLDAHVLIRLFDALVNTLKEKATQEKATGSVSHDGGESQSKKGALVSDEKKEKKKKTKRAPSAESVVRSIAVKFEVPDWNDLVKQELLRREEEGRKTMTAQEQSRLLNSGAEERTLVAISPAQKVESAQEGAQVGSRPLVALRSVPMRQKPMKVRV